MMWEESVCFSFHQLCVLVSYCIYKPGKHGTHTCRHTHPHPAKHSLIYITKSTLSVSLFHSSKAEPEDKNNTVQNEWVYDCEGSHFMTQHLLFWHHLITSSAHSTTATILWHQCETLQLFLALIILLLHCGLHYLSHLLVLDQCCSILSITWSIFLLILCSTCSTSRSKERILVLELWNGILHSMLYNTSHTTVIFFFKYSTSAKLIAKIDYLRGKVGLRGTGRHYFSQVVLATILHVLCDNYSLLDSLKELHAALLHTDASY